MKKVFFLTSGPDPDLHCNLKRINTGSAVHGLSVMTANVKKMRNEHFNYGFFSSYLSLLAVLFVVC